MRVTTVILLTSLMQVSAASFGQLITINKHGANLESVLKEVRKQSGYDYYYDSKILSKNQQVNVSLNKVTIEEALENIFKGLSLTYEIDNKTVVIRKKEPSFLDGLIARFQSIDVRGRILDEQKNPLVGATIRVKETDQSAVADEKGQFLLKNVDEKAVLTIVYIGYTTREIVVSNDLGDIVMSLSNNKLEEIVAVGYGSTKRKDLTGAVSSIKVAEIKDVPFMSVDDALTGKASGMQVIKADGSPGGAVRIRIRGGASLIGTNDPLYVIDGIPTVVTNNFMNAQSDIVNPIEAANYGEDFNNSVSGAFARGLNNLAGLNISDIETIDILKDASATAIYGSKAANGVVIITTKKGRQNTKPQLNANYYSGVNTPLKEKVLNAEQYKTILKEAASNYIDERKRLGYSLTSAGALQALAMMNNPSFFGSANTDWLDKVLRTGYTHNADVSVNGGGAGSRYYTSLNYTKQGGTIEGSDFNRLSGKMNLDNEIGSRFKVIANLNYAFTKTNITSGAYGQALNAPPVFNVFNADGSYATLGSLSSDYQGFQNPVALTTVTNRAKDYTLMGSLSGEYELLKELKFKSTFSANYSNYNQLNYTPSYVDVGGFYGRETSGGGLGSQSTSNTLSTFIENTLTWNKTFNEKHRLNVLVGTSWEKNRMDFFSATGRGYPDDNFMNNLTSAAAAVSVRGANPSGQSSLLSFYVRANYVFKDKYLFTFTGRSDASSKFGPGNQIGYFPSGAVAWRVSEEKFLKNVSWIDEIKLRVSAGRTGTQSIGDHLWRTLYTPDSYAGLNAMVPTQLGNANIKWETTTQQDVGLDFTFFGGRLGGTFGYYNKVTDGALLNTTPALSSSYSSVIFNIAKIRNRGPELELHGDFIRKRHFSWTGALNISRNISKVLNIDGGPFSDPNNRNSLSLGTSIIKEGEPLGLLYGKISAGIIKTQQQLDAYKAAFPWYPYFQPYVNIGDMAYVIGDDEFWKDDIIGRSAPKFFGGYTNVFNYKGLSLTSLFTFSYGGQLMYQKDVSDFSMGSLANRGISVLDHYSKSNPDARRPRPLLSDIPFLTDENVYNSSYLKLKSLTLGYNLPAKITRKIKLNNMSVFATGTNLFTITPYPGPDPEVSDDPGSVIGGGRDVSTYPTVRAYTFGVRLGF